MRICVFAFGNGTKPKSGRSWRHLGRWECSALTRGNLENSCTVRGDAQEVWWSSPGHVICTSQRSTRHFWVLLVLFQIPTHFGEGKEGGVRVWLCILQGAGCCSTQLLGDFPNCGAAAEGLGAGYPSLSLHPQIIIRVQRRCLTDGSRRRGAGRLL